jgi:hypothetical protein
VIALHGLSTVVVTSTVDAVSHLVHIVALVPVRQHLLRVPISILLMHDNCRSGLAFCCSRVWLHRVFLFLLIVHTSVCVQI